MKLDLEPALAFGMRAYLVDRRRPASGPRVLGRRTEILGRLGGDEPGS